MLQESYGFVGETFDRATKIEKVMKPDVRFTFTHRQGKTSRRYSDAFADAYEKTVGGMVNYRLKGAPSLISSLWLTAWQNGGKPNLNELMTPNKTTKEEKEKFATELTAWKRNTLSQDQLLLAQQKAKKVEVADEIKSAKDMADSPGEAAEPAPAPSSGEATPAIDKLKVKSKGKDGTEKIKQKGDAPQ